MALVDILERIEAETASETAAILSEAEARSEAVLAEAREGAARDSERALERARARAAADTATTVAGARLAARDRELAVRRELVTRVLAEAQAAIAALPAERYAAFLARRVAASAVGGERVLVAEADRARLGGALRAEVERIAPDLKLEWPDDPADVATGCVLHGVRVRADLSVASAIAERRAELEMIVSRTLFGTEG